MASIQYLILGSAILLLMIAHEGEKDAKQVPVSSSDNLKIT